MGFHRTIQPSRPPGVITIDYAQIEARVAEVVASMDPFQCDDPCPLNAGGPHVYAGSCGNVVCLHCSKIAWG